MKAILVTLKCLTNMHVGNGDVNYNIVDNEVEKDPVTGYPTINASGVKGALRAHFKGNKNERNWFGSDAGEKSNPAQGKLKFLCANMLVRPLRATGGKEAYYLVYTDEMRKQYETLCKAFNVDSEITVPAKSPVVSVEGETTVKSIKISGITAYEIEDISCYDLPVIARNHLDNGISTNLWYEEVVPHESVFYFFVTSEEEEILSDFKEAINGQVIQFGGNATIGYGLCKVSAR